MAPLLDSQMNKLLQYISLSCSFLQTIGEIQNCNLFTYVSKKGIHDKEENKRWIRIFLIF